MSFVVVLLLAIGFVVVGIGFGWFEKMTLCFFGFDSLQREENSLGKRRKIARMHLI